MQACRRHPGRQVQLFHIRGRQSSRGTGAAAPADPPLYRRRRFHGRREDYQPAQPLETRGAIRLIGPRRAAEILWFGEYPFH